MPCRCALPASGRQQQRGGAAGVLLVAHVRAARGSQGRRVALLAGAAALAHPAGAAADAGLHARLPGHQHTPPAL